MVYRPRMRILVVGGGGREHALVWKIAQSPLAEKVFCAPGNPGTARLAENVAIAADEHGLAMLVTKMRHFRH